MMIKNRMFPLLTFISMAIAGHAQQPKLPVKQKDNTRFVYFDGYEFGNLRNARESVQVGVMDTRVDDIFHQQTPPKYAAGVKPDPKYKWRPFFPKSPMMLGAWIDANRPLSTYQVNILSKSYIGRILPDSVSVTVLAMGINAQNVNNFRYHVVANDSTEIVPWTIPLLQQYFGAKKPYGFLGKYKSAGKQLMIEVVNIKDYSLRDGMIFNWRSNIAPPKINNITAWQTKERGGWLNINNLKTNKGYASKFEKGTGLPLDLHFSRDSINDLVLYFKEHSALPYDIYWVPKFNHNYDNGAKDMIAYNVVDSVFHLNRQYFSTPGKYELWIYPTWSKDDKLATRLCYEVTHNSQQTMLFTVTQIIPFVFLALLLFGISYIVYIRRLRKAELKKLSAQLQLHSVRTQLNPHFMFNALASIQNLVNNKDMVGANKYLAKFAGLTRRVLGTGSNELISLEDELQLIDDYLQMEQLRFAFSYTINVDAGINKANTEIPAMLLQPFIENAAKHGVSGLRDKGEIKVEIARSQQNIVLTVADNGAGFNNATSTTGNGMGIKLTEQRIALLNQLHKGQPVGYAIKSSDKGTVVTITLENWI